MPNSCSVIGISWPRSLASLRQDRLAISLSRASGVSMAVRLIGLGLSFLSQLALSRMLGVAQYGSYVIALGWAMVLVIPARLGLDNSVLRYATIYREQGRGGDFRGLTVFSVAIIAGTSLLIVAVLAALKSVSLDLLEPVSVSLLAGVALLIPGLALLGWFSALIRTANRIFASQLYEQLIRPTLLIGAIVSLGFIGREPDAGVAMLATGVTVGIALACIAVHARVVFKDIAGEPSFEHRTEWISVSWVLFLTAAVQELLNQIDIILLGMVGDAAQAAHFAAAWRLASLVPFGLVAIGMAAAPLIASAFHRRDLAELARTSRFNARFATLVAFLVSIGLVVVGRAALGMFGPGFEEAYPALLVLLAGALINSFTGTVGYLLIMAGRQRAAFAIVASALVLSIVANLILIPRFGALGAAVASAVALSAWNLAMAIYARRQFGIDATAAGLRPLRLLDKNLAERS